MQQPQVHVGLDHPDPQIPPPRADCGRDRVGQGDHVVVGLPRRVVGQVEPRELRRPRRRGPGHHPRAGLGRSAAGLVPARVDLGGGLLHQIRPRPMHQLPGAGQDPGDHLAGRGVVEVAHHRYQDGGLGLRHPPGAHRLPDHREPLQDLVGEVVTRGGHRPGPGQRGGRDLRGVAVGGGAHGGAGAGAAGREQPAAALPHRVVLRVERGQQPGVGPLARHRVRVDLEVEYLGYHRCHDSNTSSRVRQSRADPRDPPLLHLSDPRPSPPQRDEANTRRCRGRSGPRGRRRRHR